MVKQKRLAIVLNLSYQRRNRDWPAMAERARNCATLLGITVFEHEAEVHAYERKFMIDFKCFDWANHSQNSQSIFAALSKWKEFNRVNFGIE